MRLGWEKRHDKPPADRLPPTAAGGRWLNVVPESSTAPWPSAKVAAATASGVGPNAAPSSGAAQQCGCSGPATTGTLTAGPATAANTAGGRPPPRMSAPPPRGPPPRHSPNAAPPLPPHAAAGWCANQAPASPRPRMPAARWALISPVSRAAVVASGALYVALASLLGLAPSSVATYPPACTAGASGIIFALMLADAAGPTPPPGVALSSFTLPARAYPYALAAVLQFLLPGVSATGHLAGLLAGEAGGAARPRAPRTLAAAARPRRHRRIRATYAQ